MQAFQEIREFADGVGIAIGKVDFVAWLVESDLKSEVVVISNTVGLVDAQYSTWAVLNIFAAFVPLEFLALLCHADPHAVIVKTLRLCEVTNVKGDLLVLQLG